MSEPSNGSLRVWYSANENTPIFYVNVADIESASLLLNTLASYDNHLETLGIRDEDYENSGGVQIFTGEEWIDWNEYADTVNSMSEFEVISEALH